MSVQHSASDDPDTYAIIGAAMEVHRVLGCGFLKAPYRAALAIEFELRGIACAAEVPIIIRYKQRALPLSYRADFVCRDAVLVEIKALDGLGPVEVAQVLNYLKAMRLGRGLLLNFGTRSLQYRRLVWGPPTGAGRLLAGTRPAISSAVI